MHSYYCENCGREVAEDAEVCPSCGSFFSAVQCPACGYRAKAHRFYRGCPRCGYLSEQPRRAGAGDPPIESVSQRVPTAGRTPDAPSRRKELPTWVLFLALVLLIVLAAALPVLF